MMQIIDPSFKIHNPEMVAEFYKDAISGAIDTCYRADLNENPKPVDKKIAMVLERGHHSTLEHFSITVEIICDRGITHELVRHRLCSFSQESTRYCNYSGNKFEGEITVIRPFFFESDPKKYSAWQSAMLHCEDAYMKLLDLGSSPQEARTVLPNSLASKIVMTTNPREWMHIFNLRCASDAHPQMRQVMIPIRNAFCEIMPAIFKNEASNAQQ